MVRIVKIKLIVNGLRFLRNPGMPVMKLHDMLIPIINQIYRRFTDSFQAQFLSLNVPMPIGISNAAKI